MAALALDQYLMSVLRSNRSDKNEVRLEAGQTDFDLFSIYLENHNHGLHRYQMDVSTILYVVSGQATIMSGKKLLDMKAGNVLLLTQACQYEVRRQKEDSVLAKIKFNPGFKYRDFFKDFAFKGSKEEKIIKKIIASLSKEHVLWLKNNQVMRASQVMQHIIDGYLNDDLFSRALIGAELTVMMILSIQHQRLVTPSSLEKTKFKGSVLDHYIDDHFTDISLTETAHYFGFNPNYFSNLIKHKTGKNFVELVDERRMREARNLLGQPDISLKEIVNRVGYSSKSFFYKKFNEYYGETPAAMRERLFREANINLK